MTRMPRLWALLTGEQPKQSLVAGGLGHVSSLDAQTHAGASASASFGFLSGLCDRADASKRRSRHAR